MSELKQNSNSTTFPEANAKLTEQELQAINHEIQLVPYKKAAVIEALKIRSAISRLDQ